MSSELHKAIGIALDAHEGQTDKAGQPYIFHPLRVMMAMTTEAERIVAVLHDVAEDSEGGWQEIHDAGFAPQIVAAVDALTRRKAEGEAYQKYIRRCAKNPIARRVKLADLADNTSITRSSNIPSKLFVRYKTAQATLRSLDKESEPS